MKIIIVVFLMVFIVTFGFSAVKSVPNGIRFTYDAPNAENVYIAGSFNDWNSSKDKLHKNNDGIWTITLKLSPGKYQYKFFVDDNWFFDQDNPNSEDDGYGGSNSIIEVGNDGKLLNTKNVSGFVEGIKSTFNPKVYFTGRYYTKNDFIKNDNYRYYLNKPDHDLNFGIRVKLNQNFVAFTMLNINNNAENTDMWKTHLNYKKSWIKLTTPLTKITAFDNVGIYTSDDPLHILGDLGAYHYDFGYDRRGVMLSSKRFNKNMEFIKFPLDIQGQLLYSDQAGSDENDINYGKIILNFDNNTQNNGFDIKSGSAFFTYHKRESDKIRKRHLAHEFDLTFDKYLYQPGWANAMKISLKTEYMNFINSDIYDDFGTDPYIISSRYDWMNGDKSYLGLRINFPKALSVNTYFTHNSINFYKFAQNSIYTPSPELKKATLKRNRLNVKSNYTLDNMNFDFDLSYWQTQYPDSLINWSDYFTYMEYNKGMGKWFNNYSDFSFERLTLLGYKTALLWSIKAGYIYNPISNLQFISNLKATFAHQTFFKQPKYTELIFSYNIAYKKHWNFLINERTAIYNDPVLDLKTDFTSFDNLFWDNYMEISYKLKKNVKLSLGYGINPETLNKTTDEFYNGGRNEFMNDTDNYEEYLQTGYVGVKEKIINAENTLMKSDMISIRARLVF